MAGRSGMTGDCHVPFCEGLEVKLLRATRLTIDFDNYRITCIGKICQILKLLYFSDFLESQSLTFRISRPINAKEEML